MKVQAPVAVASRSFSNHPVLRQELSEQFTNITFNETGRVLAGSELVRFLSGHERAIIALERLTADVIAQLPELKVVAKYGVGLDGLDLRAMARHGLMLGWTAGVNKRSVAELTLAHMLVLCRNLVRVHGEIRSGTWRQLQGRQLSDCIVGIIGCGHVGKEVIQLLKPFGCRILINDIIPMNEYAREHKVMQSGLDQLLAESHVVTLHVPLTPSTKNLIDSTSLGKMREDSVLVNCARGGIVDEEALKDALKCGRLAGAALDVFDVEPPIDQELLNLPNFVASPHIGGSTRESVLAMGRAAIEGLSRYSPAVTFL